MGYTKIGQKAMGVAKLGQKTIHSGAQLGRKYVVPGASLASIALAGVAPEVALPLGAAAAYARPIANNIEKMSR